MAALTPGLGSGAPEGHCAPRFRLRFGNGRLPPKAGAEPLRHLELAVALGRVPADPGQLELRCLVEQVLAHDAVLSRLVTGSVRIETG
jgi:hypothetical protein